MWNPIIGRNTCRGAERRDSPASSTLLTTLENSTATMCFFSSFGNRRRKSAIISRRGVPITASGPQGEQPLLNMNNAGKGSRQNRPVTLGKGLALVRRRIKRGKVGDVHFCVCFFFSSFLQMDCGGLDRVRTLWLARARAFVRLLGLCTILGVHSPPSACLRLELQRARGIRLFN